MCLNAEGLCCREFNCWSLSVLLGDFLSYFSASELCQVTGWHGRSWHWIFFWRRGYTYQPTHRKLVTQSILNETIIPWGRTVGHFFTLSRASFILHGGWINNWMVQCFHDWSKALSLAYKNKVPSTDIMVFAQDLDLSIKPWYFQKYFTQWKNGLQRVEVRARCRAKQQGEIL